MDYTRQPLFFKIKKAARYARIYGMDRTLVKVRSHYHMKRQYRTHPPLREGSNPKAHVGLLGCGKFAYGVVAYYLKKEHGSVIKGVMDTEINRAISVFQDYKAEYYCEDARRIIEDDGIDLVYICSNHATHADYAIAALEAGKHVHIEKPHVVDEDQLTRLCAAAERAPGRIALGFNRPNSPLSERLFAALNSQSGPAVLNWFVAGHQIEPEHWYHAQGEGGRVLGNLCHWTDFVLRLVPEKGRYPIRIVPARWEEPDCNLALSLIFGDGTVAAITFSEKGPPFEGVKERFAAHKGDVLLTLDDFEEMAIQVGEKKSRTRLRHRDHGHRGRVLESYAMSQTGSNSNAGSSIAYIWETGELFLKTKQALEQQREMTVTPYRGASVDISARRSA